MICGVAQIWWRALFITSSSGVGPSWEPIHSVEAHRKGDSMEPRSNLVRSEVPLRNIQFPFKALFSRTRSKIQELNKFFLVLKFDWMFVSHCTWTLIACFNLSSLKVGFIFQSLFGLQICIVWFQTSFKLSIIYFDMGLNINFEVRNMFAMLWVCLFCYDGSLIFNFLFSDWIRFENVCYFLHFSTNLYNITINLSVIIDIHNFWPTYLIIDLYSWTLTGWSAIRTEWCLVIGWWLDVTMMSLLCTSSRAVDSVLTAVACW